MKNYFPISNILISAYFVDHSVEKEDIIHNVDGLNGVNIGIKKCNAKKTLC